MRKIHTAYQALENEVLDLILILEKATKVGENSVLIFWGQLIYPYLSNVNDYYFRIMRMWVKHEAVCEATLHALNHISVRL